MIKSCFGCFACLVNVSPVLPGSFEGPLMHASGLGTYLVLIVMLSV